LIGRLNQTAADGFLPLRAFKPSSSDSADRGRNIIRVILRRIPEKNDRCAFTRGSRGEVMIFFEKNKVLGVEPNRVLNILEGI
jgi:hypothetical protein